MWELSDPKCVKAAWALFYRSKPQLLVCSPPCTVFSSMQNINGPIPEDRWREAVAFVELCVEMCKVQMKAGRMFVFEHPAYASSWQIPGLKELREHGEVEDCILHMCQHGMTAIDEDGVGPVYKPTRILTNSGAIAEKVSKTCQGCPRHVRLEGGKRCRQAQEWPPGLVDAILDGLVLENMYRGEVESVLYSVTSDMCDAQEQEVQETMIGVDDVTGEPLDPQLIRQARQEEMNGFKEQEVYIRVPRSQWKADEKGIKVGVRWVDTNKGTKDCAQMRGRLVAQEFASKDKEGLFAAIPPLSAARTLLS